MDTGAELCAPRHQLTRINLADMDMMEMTEGDTVSIEIPQEMFVDAEPKATTEANDRWANLDPRQLDELAKNSTSKSTQNQTKWAVQIFRGKFFHWFSRWCLTAVKLCFCFVTSLTLARDLPPHSWLVENQASRSQLTRKHPQ